MSRWLVVLMTMAGCGSDPAPSCNEAFTAYYAAGCTFVDLQSGQPVPVGQAIAGCQGAAATTPVACRDTEDDLLRCIDTSSPASQCDCSQEQMALIRCGG